MITATLIGTMVGLAAGYFGGWVDSLLMRLVDVLSSIPWLVLVDCFKCLSASWIDDDHYCNWRLFRG